METDLIRWAVKWKYKNKLDGLIEHFVFEDYNIKLFNTKREALVYIKLRYGYIAKRKDLRNEPHCWRMPKPVKVKIIITEKL